MSLLSTFNIFHILSNVSSVAFVQVNVCSASKDKKFVKKWATVEWVFSFPFSAGRRGGVIEVGK